MKNLIIPYHLFIHIAYKFNSKIFIITVVSNNENSLKLGFQYTCDVIRTDNIESSPSTAINKCYQNTFKTKTEYSGLAIIEFKNENIIQQLINDIVFFPIFVRIEKLAMVITNIGDLDKNRFYEIGTEFVSSYTNIIPVSKKESSIEFWSKALDPIADRKLLKSLYENNVIQLDKKISAPVPKPHLQDTIFWNSFRDTMLSNKRGSDDKIHILLIIALKFKYCVLKKELAIESETINKARKHALLYDPDIPSLQKPIRTIHRFSNVQEN
ncbi:14257_t:CDS:2, partial [Racocetra persica]